MGAKIHSIKAREIVALRGALSLAVTVTTDDGCQGVSTPESAVPTGACNSMALKISQVSTASEALLACRAALAAGYNAHPCRRRGDRDSIGDCAVGLNAGRGRAGDHNRLLAIEAELGASAVWPSKAAYKGSRQ